MENANPITRVGLDSTIPTSLGLNRIIDKLGICFVYGKVRKNMPAEELIKLRQKLTEVAIYFSEAGYICEYKEGGALKIYEAPEDETNTPPRPKRPQIEPTSKLICRIFGMFKVTFSPDGYCFLINKGNLSKADMADCAKQLQMRKFIANYNGNTNFIQVSLTPELEEITQQLFKISYNEDAEENQLGEEVITG